MASKLKSIRPAVRRALAYCYLVGHLPKGLHLQTWVDAREHLEDTDTYTERVVLEELRAELEDNDQVKAVRELCRADWYVSPRQRRARAVVVLYHSTDPHRQAWVYPDGGVYDDAPRPRSTINH